MKSGYYISKKRALILGLIITILIIIVGLTAGLINKGCSNKGSKRDGTNKGQRSPITTTLSPEEPGPWQNPFLPNYTKPVHYNLSFYPDFYFEGSTFTGTADIVINITEATPYLIVHYKMMNITEATVRHFKSGEAMRIRVIYVE